MIPDDDPGVLVPHEVGDGGLLLMPTRAHIPDPQRDDWKPATCPICGAECWETEIHRQALAAEPGLRAVCTDCGLRGAAGVGLVDTSSKKEEMAELTKALCKVKRATPGATTTAAIANVIEEIADVQIMLDQLRLIFARSTDEVEEEKLRRLLGRLNSYAEPNLHKWLNGQYEPGIWSRTVDAGAQPREGGAPDE